MRKWDEIRCQSMFIWQMFSLIYSNTRLLHLSLPVCLYRIFTISYPCVINITRDITIFGRSCIIIMFARILVEGKQFRCHWKHQNTEAWMTMFFLSISLPTPQRLVQYHYNADYYCNINMLLKICIFPVHIISMQDEWMSVVCSSLNDNPVARAICLLPARYS